MSGAVVVEVVVVVVVGLLVVVCGATDLNSLDGTDSLTIDFEEITGCWARDDDQTARLPVADSFLSDPLADKRVNCDATVYLAKILASSSSLRLLLDCFVRLVALDDGTRRLISAPAGSLKNCRCSPLFDCCFDRLLLATIVGRAVELDVLTIGAGVVAKSTVLAPGCGSEIRKIFWFKRAPWTGRRVVVTGALVVAGALLTGAAVVVVVEVVLVVVGGVVELTTNVVVGALLVVVDKATGVVIGEEFLIV